MCVKDFGQTSRKNKLVSAKWDMLRNEGDQILNEKTLKSGEEEIILGRHQAKSTFKADEYGPCLGSESV